MRWIRRPWFLLAAVCFSQQASYVVTPKYERSLSIEKLLGRIDARNDAWVGEQDYEAIHEDLEAAAQRFKKGEPSFPALDALAERFASLAVVQLKVVESNRSSAESREAGIRIRVEVAGESRQGGRLSLQGHWRTRWSKEADEHWKLASVDQATLREVRAGSVRFTDISEIAFGANPSYRNQLSKSIDHWRGLLDEAAGVDIYGHNGIAVGDYDGDGREDLYIAQPSGLPNRLYRNNGDSTFTDITFSAGTAPLAILDDTRAVLFADVDNDGDDDLIAVTASQPLLFRNTAGRFALDGESGLSIPESDAGSLTSAAIADYDNDGWLDLYICSYDFWRPGRSYNAPTPYYDATNGPPNFLFRNRGGGKFVDATKAAGLDANNNRYSFAAAWGDFNGDGRQDLYVSNDFGRNNLYLNGAGGKFRDVGADAGVDDLGAGMSAAWGDYDNDGRLDLYTGNMWSSAGQRVTGNRQFAAQAQGATLAAFQRQAKGNSLYHNSGSGRFEEQSSAGVEFGRWAWSSDFADLDNDGNLDLYIQNGYITGPDLRDL
ncbi:MAG: VCBS repeat-containing protein [Bryobacteraceae bacterium]